MSLPCNADASIVSEPESTTKKCQLLNLSIKNLRNLTNLNLYLSPGINLITGTNGSGKTSILEALYLLGVGRSFRSQQRKSYITFHQSQMLVCAKLIDSKGNNIPLGFSKSLSGPVSLRLAGQPSTMVEVARQIPLQLICAMTFDLLMAGPEVRRQFMDWGMFYVEHSYSALWQRFQKVLKQRNAILKDLGRRGGIDKSEEKSALLQSWDREFVILSEQLSVKRATFCAQLIPILTQVIHRLLPDLHIKVIYWPGWAGDLVEALQEDTHRDILRGYTHSGAQRGDLIVQVENFPAVQVLSRGQQKLLVCALLLARGQWLTDYAAKKSIYLIDDLPSELDLVNRHRVVQVLIEQKVQVLITSIDRPSMEDALSGVAYHTMRLEAGCST